MTDPKQFIFPRKKLAADLVDAVCGASPFDQSSGLFLAAPRRTGKSTFLRLDMIPEFENRGAIVILVDLWSDPDREPAELIAEAVRDAIRKSEAGIIKVLRGIGLSKFGAGGVSFELDKVGVVGGITLTDALQYLYEKTGRSIALVIDEAQHALNSQAGINAMFAIKAARDALNQNTAREIRLMAVFTGSNRDKLSNLVLGRTTPFYGAMITSFPLLDRKFTDAFTAHTNERLAEDNRFDPASVFAAFDALGRRPEELKKVLTVCAFSEGKAASMNALLAQNAAALRVDYLSKFDGLFKSLDPLEKAVLSRLISEGTSFSPFAAEALAAYGAIMGGEAPSAASVQNALLGLRAKQIVWQPARGSYALDDADMAEWYRAQDMPPRTTGAASG